MLLGQQSCVGMTPAFESIHDIQHGFFMRGAIARARAKRDEKLLQRALELRALPAFTNELENHGTQSASRILRSNRGIKSLCCSHTIANGRSKMRASAQERHETVEASWNEQVQSGRVSVNPDGRSNRHPMRQSQYTTRGLVLRPLNSAAAGVSEGIPGVQVPQTYRLVQAPRDRSEQWQAHPVSMSRRTEYPKSVSLDATSGWPSEASIMLRNNLIPVI